MLVQCGAGSFSFIQFSGLHFCLFGGEFVLYYYGVLLMLGAVAGGWLAAQELKRRGYDPEMVWDLLIYLIIGGVIGARLWHVLTPTQSSGLSFAYYLNHPLNIIDIRNGGLGIPGTIIGGLIALYFYTRKYKTVSFVEWTDIAAPGLALGQAIGRWGNFFNQELYGSPTNLPWGIYITNPQARVAPYTDLTKYPLDVTRFHPLFLYESILNLLIMLLLLWIMRRFANKLRQGDVFLAYLILYPAVRFSLEFIRVDYPVIGGIDPNQALMAVVAVIAILVLIWRHRPGMAQPETMSMAVEPVEFESVSSPEAEAELIEPVAAKKTVRKTTAKPSTTKKPSTKTAARKPAAKKKSE